MRSSGIHTCDFCGIKSTDNDREIVCNFDRDRDICDLCLAEAQRVVIERRRADTEYESWLEPARP